MSLAQLATLPIVCLKCSVLNDPPRSACAACGAALELKLPGPSRAQAKEQTGASAGGSASKNTGGQPRAKASFDAAPGARELAVLARQRTVSRPNTTSALPTIGGLFASGRATLTVVRGGATGLTLEIDESPLSIGSAAQGHSIVGDPFLAPIHATLFMRKGALVLRDEGSASGCYSTFKTPRALNAGDEFVVNERRFRYLGTWSPPQNNAAPRPFGAPLSARRYLKLRELHRGGEEGTLWAVPGTISFGCGGCDVNLVGRPDSTIRCELIDHGDRVELVDYCTPDGLLIRLPPRGEVLLSPGSSLRLGDQQLQVK